MSEKSTILKYSFIAAAALGGCLFAHSMFGIFGVEGLVHAGADKLGSLLGTKALGAKLASYFGMAANPVHLCPTDALVPSVSESGGALLDQMLK